VTHRLILLAAITCLPLASQQSGVFLDSEQCGVCHWDLPAPASAVSPESQDSIAPYNLWVGTMMANSSRDPYWRAKLRSEVAENRSARALIEDRCLGCHAPMQRYEQRMAGQRLRFDELSALGLDGVSCTLCHQITQESLGSAVSFGAGFTIGSVSLIYGPHRDPFTMPMRMHTGFTPAEAQHISGAELCATCHTVVTPTLDKEGQKVGEFLEQAPYLEWLVSDYADQQTCQSCHMPRLRDPDGRPVSQYIAHRPPGGPFPPTRPRNPFAQHFFVGANTQVIEMLRTLDPEIAADYVDTAGRARENLAQALSLHLEASLNEATLLAVVKIDNLTGHKLPTGYPSRRLWLRFVVSDSQGGIVFESGSFDRPTGEISGLGEPETPQYEPHHHRISRPDQVAVYESEMNDSEGQWTSSLLQAAGHLKDNRIPPAGFDLGRTLPAGVTAAALRPVGVENDPDFGPGSDQVLYEIDVSGHSGPFRVGVEVYYQSIKPTHLRGMIPDRSVEESRFLAIWGKHNSPGLVGAREVVVER
jgi:hypothetical protein